MPASRPKSAPSWRQDWAKKPEAFLFRRCITHATVRLGEPRVAVERLRPYVEVCRREGDAAGRAAQQRAGRLARRAVRLATPEQAVRNPRDHAADDQYVTEIEDGEPIHSDHVDHVSGE